jgi:alpha-tubulin suppressor-like RCC1 family protein
VPRCWGDNTWGNVSDAPKSAFEKLSAGGFHTCGLQLDHTALCWGQNDDGQSNVVPGEQYKDISAGLHHTCAVRVDGTLYCWGENDCDQASYPGGNSWERVYAGSQYSCALDTAGEITCWGAKETDGCDYRGNARRARDRSQGLRRALGLRRHGRRSLCVRDHDERTAPTTRSNIKCWGQEGQGATDMNNDFLYVERERGRRVRQRPHLCAHHDEQHPLRGFDTWGQCTPRRSGRHDDTGTKK